MAVNDSFGTFCHFSVSEEPRFTHHKKPRSSVKSYHPLIASIFHSWHDFSVVDTSLSRSSIQTLLTLDRDSKFM